MKIRKQFFLIFAILTAVPILYLTCFFIYVAVTPTEAIYSAENLPHPRDFVMTFAVIFEIIFTSLSLFMFNNIAKSIHLVENEAKKISDGDIDEPLKIPTNKGYSNEITNLLIHFEGFRKVFKQRKNEQDRFVMGLSHDLKTPIAIVKGYAEGISDGLFSTPQRQKEALEIILQKTAQLESMVDEIVNFIKMNEPSWTRNFAEYDLEEYLEYVEKYLQSTGSVFNRSITSEINVPKGTMVKMDKQLVSRAFENIISNAIRYTENGAEINIKAGVFENKAKIKISDNGIGMSPEETEHAFELFYRGTHSRREQGQGIGLSVVSTAMNIHGWDIAVESELGKGTSFTITIPLRQAAKPKVIF